MPEPWWQRRMAALDLETTSPLPEEARIVTAALVLCGEGEPTETRTWLADPGIDIPEGATAVHGITTSQAKSEGRPAPDVVREVVDLLTAELARGRPLAIANARFDLTVLDRECRRMGLATLTERLAIEGVPLLVVDVFVIDKWIDRYRKSYPRGLTPEQATEQGVPSTRTLEGMCLHYGVTLDGAHDAAFDALAAARLAYRLGSSGEVVRRVRNAQEGREKAALVRAWDRVRDDLPALHALQVELAADERARFAAYKDSIGEHDVAVRVRAERGWPVLEVMEREAEAA